MIRDRISYFLIISSFRLRVRFCVIDFLSFGVFFLVSFVAVVAGFHDWKMDVNSFFISFSFKRIRRYLTRFLRNLE